MWETSSTESIYKYFIFKPINGDLKYIEQMLKKYGLELDDRYGKGGDSIYVNLTDKEWGAIPPKSFWYTILDDNNEAARVDKDSSIEWALNVIKSYMSAVSNHREMSPKEDYLYNRLRSHPGEVKEELPPLEKANLKKELDNWIDMLAGDKENETYPEDFKSNGKLSFNKLTSKEREEKWEERKTAGVKKSKDKPKVTTEGKKESDGKLFYELDWDFLSQMAERMESNKSNGKYDKWNWKKPTKKEELAQAIFRHTLAVMNGEYEDDGRDYGHLEALANNAMMLNYQLKNKK